MAKANKSIQEIVDNRLKVPNGFFKWAMNDFPIYEWTNKSRTIISSDRKKFSKKVTKRLSLNSRLTFVGDTFYYVWMGVTKKRIEMQMYAVTQSFEEGKEKIEKDFTNGKPLEAKGINLEGMSKISLVESSVGISTMVVFIAIYLGIIFLIALISKYQSAIIS